VQHTRRPFLFVGAAANQELTMTRNRLAIPILIAAVAAAVLAIATTGGSSKKLPTGAVAASALSIGQTSVGSALVDANGRVLYLFAADPPNQSRLSAAGRAVWPPFTSTALPTALGGISGAEIGAIPSTHQVTYNGHPLYYYIGDRAAGQASGQGLNQFGGRWYLLSGAGAAITSAAPGGSASAPGSSSSAGGAGSYGY
jgi:predicted lipoprotein with Yx(FWY)xxD motif